MNINSTYIKKGLMNYFRFKRQWICADEVTCGCFIADILVDTGKYTMEVEIKTSKSDLITGEAKKTTGWRGRGKKKHEEWPIIRANKFALCVPKELKEVALEWIEKNNENYGLFVCYENKWDWEKRIYVHKRANLLHKEYGNIDYKYKIARRLSGIRAMQIKDNK